MRSKGNKIMPASFSIFPDVVSYPGTKVRMIMDSYRIGIFTRPKEGQWKKRTDMVVKIESLPIEYIQDRRGDEEKRCLGKQSQGSREFQVRFSPILHCSVA
jgi:hypothetical protein